MGRRRRVVLALLLLASVALAGCAGQYGGGSSPPEAQVEFGAEGLSPSSITVSVNESVMWTVVDDRTHRLETYGDVPRNFSTLDLERGDRYVFTPPEPGVYTYRGVYHSQRSGDGYEGEVGEIIVKSG